MSESQVIFKEAPQSPDDVEWSPIHTSDFEDLFTPQMTLKKVIYDDDSDMLCEYEGDSDDGDDLTMDDLYAPDVIVISDDDADDDDAADDEDEAEDDDDPEDMYLADKSNSSSDTEEDAKSKFLFFCESKIQKHLEKFWQDEDKYFDH